MNDTMKDQLQRWRDSQSQPSKQPQQPKASVLFKTFASPTRTTGKHALKTYKGIVEFPHSRGGGVLWMKSVATLNAYANKGYKVVML